MAIAASKPARVNGAKGTIIAMAMLAVMGCGVMFNSLRATSGEMALISAKNVTTREECQQSAADLRERLATTEAVLPGIERDLREINRKVDAILVRLSQ